MTTAKRRFSAPELLTDETLVLGVPAKKWDEFFIGDFEKSLAEVKQLAQRVQSDASPEFPSESSTMSSKNR